MAKASRVSDGIYELAASAGDVVNRSLADQVEYWTHLGAALDTAGVKSEQAVDVLEGDVDRDALNLEHLTGSRGSVSRGRYFGDASISKRIAGFDREVAAGWRSPDSLLLFSREQGQSARVTFAEEEPGKARSW